MTLYFIHDTILPKENYMTNEEILKSILLSSNTLNDFYSNYSGSFKTWLDNLIPEINDCIHQEQINPWHKYNVMDHILHSVEEMNKQTLELPEQIRLMLSYTMFFHDMGKPACHIRRIVDGKDRDSFFNHNVQSEKICRRVLGKLNIEKELLEIICKLVYKHDIFMFIKDFKSKNRHWRLLSPSLIKDEINDLNSVGDGERLMRYLIMVGRSDNRAQNEKMTPPSLKLLDKCDKILNDIITKSKV